jgi:hypothetical protein
VTGTPLDLTPFGGLLKGIGLLYWLAMLAVVGLALWWFERWWVKLAATAVVAAAFIAPIALYRQERQQQSDAATTKLSAAMAHFEMRCKTAGEKITRTVENVEGVVWMRWRERQSAADEDDQFKLNDPLGRDCTGEACIEQLLRLETKTGRFQQEVEQRKNGYQFVESIDPAESGSHRYVGAMVPRWSTEGVEKYRRENSKDIPDDAYWFKHERRPIEHETARYGIVWSDISTREDREHWIAGSSLKVVDLQDNEVIAERIAYLIDTGQGSKAGFRSPWGWAKTYAPRCPKTIESTLEFATKVLRPAK